MIRHTEFGLIWITPWPDEKELFLKFAKICNSRNSQSSVGKPNFFPGKAKPIFFALHSHYAGDTPYRVCFDSDNSLTRWKIPLFKFPFSRNLKSSVWNTNFFRTRYTNFFLFYALTSLVILHTEFGLIWTTPCPDEKDLFLKFLFREFQTVPYENPNFFQGKLNQKYFLLYTVITLVILNTEFGLIWRTHWPDEKELFLKFAKIRNSRIPQNSVWKPNFFKASNTNNFFGLYCHFTGDTPYRVWFDLDNSLTRWKRTIFKIRKNLQFAKFAKFRRKTQLFSRES